MTPPTDVVAIERRRLSHALLGVGGALVSTPLLAVVLAVLAWPVDTLASPGSVSANSWPTALHLARVTHAHWGPDIAFTYGPLGFLRFPFLYYTDTLRLALLYTVGAIIYAGLSRVPTKHIFTVTKVLIAILAGSIASQLVKSLAQSGLPVFAKPTQHECTSFSIARSSSVKMIEVNSILSSGYA